MVFIAQIWIKHHLKIFVHLYWFNWSIIKVYNWVQWSSFLPTKHNLLSLLFRVWVKVNFPMKSWITYFLSKSLLKSLAEVLFFFFYLGFLSRTFTIHRAAGAGGGYQINSSLPFPPRFTDTYTLRRGPTSAHSYNHFHNILRLFDVLNFPFTTSETMRDYFL